MQRTALFLVAVLLAAPLAEAGPKPTVYFLKDIELAQGYKVPIGDGVLSTLPPPPLPDPNAPQNTTQPASSRVIFPYLDAVAPAQFVANATANTGRVFGVVFVFVVLPRTAAMQQATLNITLVELPADPPLPPVPGGGGKVLAWGRVPLDYTNSSLPNATAFVPPNATADPQAAVNYTTAQLVSYGLSTVAEWMTLVFLDDHVADYLVDAKVDPKARLAFRFVLENGTSQNPPIPTAPVPVGAGQDILYDNALLPSLGFIPWYEADPPKPTPTTTTSPPATSTPAPTTTESPTTKAAIALPFGILLAAMFLVAARRRL